MSDKVKYEHKKIIIEKTLSCDPVDVTALRKLAIAPGGLVNAELRCSAWPHLLNVVGDVFDMPKNVRSHSEYRQVCLDVERCGGRFPKNMPETCKKNLQEQLTNLILGVLSKHPELHYYQGYHDICITFLFVCDYEQSLVLVERLSTHHLRDFMDPSMQNTTNILNYLIPILEKANLDLVKFLLDSEVGTIFAISWLITWFSYVIVNQDDIERLYDFFLACHPLMPIYFAAQIVLDHSKEIMGGECEMARVHSFLLKIARKDDLPLESLISRASDFYIQYPPSSLAKSATCYKSNLAMSTFSDFALVAKHELPDIVLQRHGLVSKEENSDKSKKNSFSYGAIFNLTTAAVGGAVGTAIIAVAGHATEWVPQLLSYF